MLFSFFAIIVSASFINKENNFGDMDFANLLEDPSPTNSTTVYHPPSIAVIIITMILGTVVLGCIVLYLCVAKTDDEEKEIISNLLDATPYR